MTNAPPPPSRSPPTSVNPLPSLPLISDLSHCDASPPTRKIFTEVDIEPWTRSEAYQHVESLILRLVAAVQDVRVDDELPASRSVDQVVQFLEQAETWVDDIPLEQSPQRFGNKAFRAWLDVVQENEQDLQRSLLSTTQLPVLAELSHHFRTSFGSGARLDYGTGHELSFLAYILILRLIGVFTEQDERAIVLRVFVAYLAVVRKLQKVFKLEPAGSKGVWGLDDHQHLVYLWGAAQLQSHPSLRPNSILSPSSIAPYSHSYLFLSSILHVNELKRGPFAEHSPMLHTIATTVPNWTKVTSGLLKMYRVEVLGKVPVVQHFWFGAILAWKDAKTSEELPSSGDGMHEEEKMLVEELDDGEKETDEGTVAPWKLPTVSGERLPAYTTSRSSLGFQRQQPATAAPAPRPFVPPTLFPIRRKSSPLCDRTDEPKEQEEEKTVASEGGAAASSSPFGVLQSATLR